MWICEYMSFAAPFPGEENRFVLIALPRKGVLISSSLSLTSTLLFLPFPLPLLMPPPGFLSLNASSFPLHLSVNTNNKQS